MIHDTLRQLETNGYAFTVDEAGDIAYTYRPIALPLLRRVSALESRTSSLVSRISYLDI
jgi:hypothetical protein